MSERTMELLIRCGMLTPIVTIPLFVAGAATDQVGLFIGGWVLTAGQMACLLVVVKRVKS